MEETEICYTVIMPVLMTEYETAQATVLPGFIVLCTDGLTQPTEIRFHHYLETLAFDVLNLVYPFSLQYL